MEFFGWSCSRCTITTSISTEVLNSFLGLFCRSSDAKTMESQSKNIKNVQVIWIPTFFQRMTKFELNESEISVLEEKDLGFSCFHTVQFMTVTTGKSQSFRHSYLKTSKTSYK